MPIRPELGHPADELVGEVLRLVPRHDVRTDLGLGELAHAAPQDLLLVGKSKVHGCVRLP